MYASKNWKYYRFTYIPSEMLKDKDIAMAALRISPYNMIKDRELILAIAENSGNLYVSQEFKDEYFPNLANDKEYLLKAAERSTGVLQAASEELRKDRELLLEALQSGYFSDVHLIKDYLKSDMEIIEKFIETASPTIFDIDLFPKHLIEDDEFFYRMISKRTYLIRKLSHHAFFKDKRNILKLIAKGRACYQILSQELREDKDIKLALIKIGDYPTQE